MSAFVKITFITKQSFLFGIERVLYLSKYFFGTNNCFVTNSFLFLLTQTLFSNSLPGLTNIVPFLKFVVIKGHQTKAPFEGMLLSLS